MLSKIVYIIILLIVGDPGRSLTSEHSNVILATSTQAPPVAGAVKRDQNEKKRKRGNTARKYKNNVTT